MIQASPNKKTFDTVVIGGGVLGLWSARRAMKAGEDVLLLEKRKIGAGASGGFLGALMPHMPEPWNAKKAFQYSGLSTLSAAVEELQDETGIDCGYRRCGRIMPVMHEKLLPQLKRRTQGAEENWEESFELKLTATQNWAKWMASETAPLGVQYDSLSARINPQAYLKALAASVQSGCDVREGVEAVTLDQVDTGDWRIKTSEDGAVMAKRVVVASGWEAYALLQPFMGALNNQKPIGRGVKGQAILIAFDHDDDLPIVYHDGTYVVPHAGNRVAIGSTSVNDWQTGNHPIADVFDPDDMSFYENALKLVPCLKDAPIIGRWSGVRPRNTLEGRGTSPWFGPVPEHEGLVAMIGGFKITLGIAHLENYETSLGA